MSIRRAVRAGDKKECGLMGEPDRLGLSATSIRSERQRVLAGRYRLEQKLGAGGMGAVYVAVDVQAGRRVAVKLLTGSDARLRARFAQEARILGALQSPHALKLFDYGLDVDGTPYLVSELLTGRPLSDLIAERGKLSEPIVLHVLHGVAEALTEAHAAGVIHRDIKPANIFVSVVADREYVKLLDFGIAKATLEPGMTGAGYLLGTPQYIAPEQALEEVRPASDVYSLGVVAYECLCGSRPFLGTTLPMLLRQHADELPIPLSARSEPVEVSPALEALVLEMLAKRPHDRPMNGHALRARVESIQKSAAISADALPTLVDVELREWALRGPTIEQGAPLAAGSQDVRLDLTAPVASATPAMIAAPTPSLPTRQRTVAWALALFGLVGLAVGWAVLGRAPAPSPDPAPAARIEPPAILAAPSPSASVTPPPAATPGPSPRATAVPKRNLDSDFNTDY